MSATITDTTQWLHDYFIQHGSLTLPGVGTFRLQRISAQVDFANKKMLPPTFTIRFDHRHDTPQREMFTYVSQRSGMADWEAVRCVNNLAFDFKSRLLHGESVPVKGIGTLRPDQGSGFQFDADRLRYDFIPNVRADRVVRKDAEHSVRVGDNQRSRAEMEELLQTPEELLPLLQRIWFRALLLSICAILLLGLRFMYPMQHGLTVRMDRIHPVDPPTTHTTLKAP